MHDGGTIKVNEVLDTADSMDPISECWWVQLDYIEAAGIAGRPVRRDVLAMLAPPGAPFRDCTECIVPARGRKTLCDKHRCQKIKKNGERCKMHIGDSKYSYCIFHGDS